MSLNVFVVVVVAMVVWRIVKQFKLTQSPLAHVPGPAKEHWLKGHSSSNYEIFDFDGHPQEIIIEYFKMV